MGVRKMFNKSLILKGFKSIKATVDDNRDDWVLEKRTERVNKIISEVIVGNISHEQMFTQFRRVG